MKTSKFLPSALSAITASFVAVGVLSVASADNMSDPTQRNTGQTTNQNTDPNQNMGTNPHMGDPANRTGMGQRSFQQLDKDGNGKLNWRELNDTYRTQIEGANLNEEEVFRKYDRNADRSMDENEFQRFSADINKNQDTQPAFEEQSSAPGQNDGLVRQASLQAGENIKLAQNNPGNDRVDQPVVPDSDMRTQDPVDRQQDLMDSQNSQEVELNGDRVSAEQVRGKEVVTLNEEKVGTVKDVVTNAEGGTEGLVIKVDMEDGTGQKDIFVHATKLKMSGDQVVWQTRLDKKSLENIPAYDEELVSGVL